jgi:two-component system sensor histidine kinase VanS
VGTTAPTSTGSMQPVSATIALRSSSDILDASLQVSVLVLLALVIVGAVIAWLVSGRILRPLQSVNDAARLAGTGSFDHRLSLGGPRDELRDLADTVDDMLGKLDRAFGASDRFAANASHELRTPLAATQTMLEVALADPDAGIDDLRETARRVLETNRRGIETVEALLDLSELEHREPMRAPVPLDVLVREVLRECDDERARRGISVTVELDSTAIALGDAVLLRQAVGNLVHNAIRHNTVGGEVRITALQTDAAIELRIENTGQQLTPEAVASFPEPFVRGAGRVAGSSDEARGHGLGLAIVESVAHAHDGRLRLAARDGGGLVAELELPS